MNENTKEKLGCIIFAIIILIAVFIGTRINDKSQLRKLDVCNDRGYTAEQCRQNWGKIK